MIIFAKLNAHLVLTYIAAQTRLQYKYKFRESDEKKKIIESVIKARTYCYLEYSDCLVYSIASK